MAITEYEVVETELTLGPKTLLSFFVTTVAANVATYFGMAVAAKWLKQVNDEAEKK